MTDKQPTQEQVIAWAHKAEIGDSHGHIIRHELAHLERFAAIAYEAGRKDENEALAQPEPEPEPEPVAWYLPNDEGYDSMFRDHQTIVACTGSNWEGWKPLYIAPPQRKPLTGEEIDSLILPTSGCGTVQDFVRVIEAAHGIKD